EMVECILEDVESSSEGDLPGASSFFDGSNPYLANNVVSFSADSMDLLDAALPGVQELEDQIDRVLYEELHEIVEQFRFGHSLFPCREADDGEFDVRGVVDLLENRVVSSTDLFESSGPPCIEYCFDSLWDREHQIMVVLRGDELIHSGWHGEYWP
ncbi:MAG: hypothetical protein AAF078_07895, partial [Planctomycetota bacterium]